MEKERLFKILDAMMLSPELVKEYLEKICSQTPLNVVYRHNDGEIEISSQVLTWLEIIGYVLGDIVLFKQVFNQYEKVHGLYEKEHSLNIADIRLFGTKIHLKAHPIGYKELLILNNHIDLFNQTSERLAYNKCTPFHYLPAWFIPIEDTVDDQETQMPICTIDGRFNGSSNLGDHLKVTGNFYYYCQLNEL